MDTKYSHYIKSDNKNNLSSTSVSMLLYQGKIYIEQSMSHSIVIYDAETFVFENKM
jgi:hypothetical protein